MCQRTSTKKYLLELDRLYNKAGNINPNIKKMLPAEILHCIEELYFGVSIGIAVYCIIHDIVQPTCVCNKTVTYYNKKINAFSNYCSIQCSTKSADTVKKRAQTKLDKYGSAGFNNRSLAKKTNIEKYGVDNPSKNNLVKQKIQQTVVEKYKSGDIQNKRQQTFDKRYSGHPQQTIKVKEKKKQNTLKKYGVEHTTQLPRVIEQIQNSKEQSYLDQYQWVIDYITTSPELKLRTVLAKETGVSLNIISHLVDKYNLPHIEVEIGTSSGEKELCDFLKTNNIEFQTNNRSLLSGQEIDIYIPKYNLAIEFNGIYWHSEKFGKSANYHLNKTEICQSQNIQLLHIWDHEWQDIAKQDIWKSMILSKAGKYQHIIGARKTKFDVVNRADAREFLENNHLSGFVKSKDHYGLYYNNQLIMLASFSHSRYSKSVDTELIRLCTKKDHLVVGGASKLFARQPNTKFVSYANRRYSTGNVYNQTGLTFITQTKPNYWYYIRNQLQSRLQFQKHKLKEKIKIFDPTLTEVENMHKNNYYRVWDCGNLTYVYERT